MTSSPPPRPDIPILASLPLVITTARLRLRPVDTTDADALFPIVRDPELPRMMSWSPHTSIDETRGWVEYCQAALVAGTDVVWALERAGAPIGAIGLHGIRWQLRALRVDRAELGYWIAPAHGGQGLMTEAAQAVTAWAFDTLGLHKVTVKCFEPNVGSRRVIEKCGFRFVGRTEEDVWRDGQWFAHLEYERLRD